jgi:quinol monooxygenase YgiN
MLTIFFYITVKPGREQEFDELALRLTRITREEDAGCLAYIFHRQLNELREYVLYEQWENQQHLNNHLSHLRELLGPAAQGEVLPESLLNMCESTHSVLYQVLA